MFKCCSNQPKVFTSLHHEACLLPRECFRKDNRETLSPHWKLCQNLPLFSCGLTKRPRHYQRFYTSPSHYWLPRNTKKVVAFKLLTELPCSDTGTCLARESTGSGSVNEISADRVDGSLTTGCGLLIYSTLSIAPSSWPSSSHLVGKKCIKYVICQLRQPNFTAALFVTSGSSIWVTDQWLGCTANNMVSSFRILKTLDLSPNPFGRIQNRFD